MKPALVVLVGLALLAARPGHAETTFEARASAAERVRHLEDIVWALTAACDGGDDVAQRQCRHLRDTRVAALATTTLLVEADPEALEVGKWDPAKKSVAVRLAACIRCGGLVVEGKSIYVVGSAAQPRFEGDRLRANPLYDTARGFPNQNAANTWTAAVRGARVELLAKVPAQPRWQLAGKPGVALEIVGYRVSIPCTGVIVIASDAAQPLPADPRACGKSPPVTEPGLAPVEDVDQLSPEMIHDALRPVVDAANLCFGKLGITGKAKLMITIAADGSIAKYDQQGDFRTTPTGDCIDRAVGKVQFPRSKQALTKISYPIVLR